MDRAPESIETQARRVGGAEIARLPDGSATLRLSTPDGIVGARGYLRPGAPTALFAGPAGFSPLLRSLALGLAARAGQALLVQPFGGRDPAQDLAAAAEFCRRSGGSRLLVAGAGELSPAALEATRDLDADAVLLLSPRRTPDAATAERLGGRTLILCTASPREAVLTGRLPNAQAFAFPRASPALLDVGSDLLALVLPVLARALGLEAEAREA